MAIQTARTFKDMVAEAREEVPALSPEEAQQRAQQDPNTLIVDVRDANDLVGKEVIPGSKNVSLGTLPIKADQELAEELRDPDLQDRSRPIITNCGAGGQAALGAKLLKDMGFRDVSFIEGGMKGWKAAGLPTEQVGSSNS